MSWKIEVVADKSGKWCSNQLRFATREEAVCYAMDLTMRWTSVRDCRVRTADEPPNTTYCVSDSEQQLH